MRSPHTLANDRYREYEKVFPLLPDAVSFAPSDGDVRRLLIGHLANVAPTGGNFFPLLTADEHPHDPDWIFWKMFDSTLDLHGLWREVDQDAQVFICRKADQPDRDTLTLLDGNGEEVHLTDEILTRIAREEGF